MGKISPSSIKYNIKADFEAEGPLEKTDVIGAIFGQTEGLLGSDMELRELQQEGKIGRIDVNLIKENGKTKGEIIIPSALDKTETSLIGAALETIDKIGPTEAKIVIKKIEDVRGNKREYILKRAKDLLQSIQGESLESKEIEQEIKESTRISKIGSYGEENLPCGDLSEKEIIVVEGRADVINLVRHNILNVIGMNGTKLPKEIVELGNEKEITLFVDGDRGGLLIAKNVVENAKVSYIAQAPDGKEVEELTGKEINQALRKKQKPEEFFKKNKEFSGSPSASNENLKEEDKKKLKEILKELKSNCFLFDEKINIIKKTSINNLIKINKIERKPFLVLVEKANSELIKASEKIGAKYLVAKNFEEVIDTKVKLISI
ncbi:MAG: DNA primase DnaG [Candidatus Pacearchaeota archaeon]